VDGRYMVEDLGSGNGTYVNDKAVTRHFLSHRDVIRVCSARFEFQEHEQRPDAVTYVGDPAAMAQIVKRVDANQPLFRQDAAALTTVTDPKAVMAMAERLETIYAVSEAISSILDLDELLPEIVNRVFAVFPKAERVLLMLTGEDGHLVPKVVKRRSESDEAEVKVSQTILHEVTTQRNAVLSHDAMEDLRFKGGRSVANFGIRAMMAAPLVWRTEVLGVLYLDSFGIAAFSQADLSLLTGIAGQSAGAVGNARLHEELLKRQRLERDLHLAERIQQSFLPRRIPKVRNYTFSARYDPAYEVGGDFYDFIRLPDDRLGLVVADVSGKGVSAALYMARLTRDLRYFALAETDPARVLGWMNRAVIEFGQDDMFVTLLYAVLDAHGRRLLFANAGHMPPVVRRKDEGEVLVLDQVSGLPLGVLPDAEYETDTFQLVPGDSVMLYTDGLVEAMSPAREMFGMERLTAAMAEGTSDAAQLLERALTRCRDHVADAPQFDDTTVVCLGLEAQAPEDAPRTGEIDVGQGAYRSRRPRPRTRT
jgi:sigma-B regulation protein RsbU (phosphoserine phosphatase)